MKFGKFLKFIKATIIFTIIFMWIFFGWPQVMEFPPEVKVAQAAQFGRPISDITTEWTPSTGSTHFGVLDEAVMDDADYVSTTAASATFEVKFSALTDPQVSTGHILRIRAYAAGSGGPEKLNTWGLYQGTTAIVTANTSITRNSFNEYSITLSAAQADTITDYSDLRLRATAAQTAGETLRVSFAEFEVPDLTLTTTLGSGTDPSAQTVAPGVSATDIDAFTFQTNSGTDNITQATTTFSSDISAGVSEVQITSDDGSTIYGTSTLSGATASITLSPNIVASSTSVQYKIRVVPKIHSAMDPPPGAAYTATATISAWTGTNTQAGSDSNANALTIDNLSPNGATATSGSAGDAQVTLNWTTSNSSDFNSASGSVVYRWAAGSAGSEVPAEGSTPTIGSTNGTATAACVVSSASSTALSKIDGSGGSADCATTALTNGQQYTYKVFQKDSYGNYDVGVSIGTFTPNVAPTISCSTNISATSFGNLTTASVFTSSPNASTTMSCANTSSGCTLYVKDAGNGSNPGLATSSPAYLIPSTTATLSAGTEGYGIQATTTASGSGGVLNINAIYNKTGNDVGGLSLNDLTLASSTVNISNREVITTHKATISNVTISGNYSDTITYSCFVN